MPRGGGFLCSAARGFCVFFVLRLTLGVGFGIILFSKGLRGFGKDGLYGDDFVQGRGGLL